MCRLLTILLAGLLLLASGLGCGSAPSKGAEKDKDMPKPVEKEP